MKKIFFVLLIFFFCNSVFSQISKKDISDLVSLTFNIDPEISSKVVNSVYDLDQSTFKEMSSLLKKMDHSQNIETALLSVKEYSNTKSFKILSDLSGINTNTISVIIDKCITVLHGNAADWVCLGLDFIDEVNASYNKNIYDIIINDLKATYPDYNQLIASDYNDFCNNGNYLMYYLPKEKSIRMFFVGDIKKEIVYTHRIIIDENCTTCNFDKNILGNYTITSFYNELDNSNVKGMKKKKEAFINYYNNVLPNNIEYIEYLKKNK